MKLALFLAAIFCALLLGGCADQSLLTDEEYAKRPPAPFSPDPMQHVPDPGQYDRPGGY